MKPKSEKAQNTMGGQSLRQQCHTAIHEKSCKNTRKVYIRLSNRFIEWSKDNGYTAKAVRADSVGVLNAYSAYLQKQGYSPATIHTYLAAPCSALGVDLAKIRKPRRTGGMISRSRIATANPQGRHEAQSGKYNRSIALQKALGIRRAELGRLRGSDYITDSSGYPCVRVRRGKGGKMQMQRILPQDQPLVASYFNGTDSPVFEKAELANKIDYHGMRAAHAREAYRYYLAQVQTEEGREALKKELRQRFQDGNPHGSAQKRNRFEAEIENATPRGLRGENRIRAIDKHLPTEYDRVALMAVSVFLLSHWRNDVTITNYLL